MLAKFRIYNLLLICSCLSNNLFAERILVHLSDSTKIAKLAPAKIIWDLHPLPWLVLEIPNIRRDILTQDIDWQVDGRGHFVANTPIPNDSSDAKQWHLAEIGVSKLWQQTQGEGITIALLDSGVDPNHPNLTDNILFEQGYDFGEQDEKPYDANGHGTAMAGLIVANCNNEICGVAPAAKLIPYKINKSGSSGFLESDLAIAIKTAADSSAQIISLSLVLDAEHSQIVQDALLYAKAKNKVIVAAAGNLGEKVAFPANLPWVIGVGAIDKNGQRLRSSNYGNGLSLLAPGARLWTTLPGTGYADWYDGTSASAALVTGVLALMAVTQPDANELAVELLTNCQDVDINGFDEQSGFGHLRATNTSTIADLKFSPATVLSPGDTLELDLFLQNLIGKVANLYLRVSFPVNGSRLNLFKIWNSDDSVKKIAYNSPLAIPYKLTSDLFLPLYGSSTALLGDGIIYSGMTEGFYELSASLVFTDESSLQARKIIWVKLED